MSQTDVELVQRFFEAFRRRDVEGLQADVTEGFEIRPLMSAWEAYRGAQGLADWLDDVDGVWETFEAEVREFRSFRPGVVIVLGECHGRPVGRSDVIDMPLAGVVWLDGERLAKAAYYATEQQALTAADAGA